MGAGTAPKGLMVEVLEWVCCGWWVVVGCGGDGEVCSVRREGIGWMDGRARGNRPT